MGKERVYNYSRAEKKEKVLIWLITIAVTVITLFCIKYFTCFALNIHSVGMWVAIVISCVVGAFGGFFALLIIQKPSMTLDGTYTKPATCMVVAALVPLVIIIIFSIMSAGLFNASKYRERITVIEKNESDFETDIPSTKDIGKIALMDTESAKKLGDRVLGSLSDVVSQFEMGEYYTIELNGEVRKVAPLEYGGFFKWNSNKDKGIPGYVVVNPLTSEAEFVEVSGGMKYAPSAYFDEDLLRHVRSQYPTKLLGDYVFQIDNEGNAYWTIVTFKTATMFGCASPDGVIACNAVTGDCVYYDLEQIPEWVDQVFDGYTVEQLYNDYGRYANGAINFSKKGITATTDDFGYFCVGSDVYIYTGITSIASDESNLGFVLVNSRTGQFNYYPIAGAEEYSAMSAAAGAVQNYGYKASFPSLVNVNGNPTYVMVLKDSNNLVKMYGMVNVKNYTIVATGNTLSECLNTYNKALINAGTSADIDNMDGAKNKNVTIMDIQFVTVDGNTTVYLKGDDGKVYKQAFAKNENLILLNVGDTVKVTYSLDEDIISILEIEKIN